MQIRRWFPVPIIAISALLSLGCGLFHRNKNTTTVSSNVEVSQQGRDIATLRRGEYEVIGTSLGEDVSRRVYVLTIPVGSQTGASEGIANAYYDAVDRNPQCDAIVMPRVETKRIVIPLILVNIIVRKNRVKGRCVHILENDTLGGDTPRDRYQSPTTSSLERP